MFFGRKAGKAKPSKEKKHWQVEQEALKQVLPVSTAGVDELFCCWPLSCYCCCGGVVVLLLALVPLSVTYSLCLVDSLYVCHLVATVSTCCSSCHHYRCWLGRSFISCELTWLKVASMCLTLQGKAPPPKPESSFSLTKLQAQRDEVERADARSASAALAAPSRGSKDVFAKDQHAIVWLEIAISGKVTVACLSCARYASTGCLPHRSSSSGNNTSMNLFLVPWDVQETAAIYVACQHMSLHGA